MVAVLLLQFTKINSEHSIGIDNASVHLVL